MKPMKRFQGKKKKRMAKSALSKGKSISVKRTYSRQEMYTGFSDKIWWVYIFTGHDKAYVREIFSLLFYNLL